MLGANLTPFESSVEGVTICGVRGGAGPPALLLHGTAGSWRNFTPWLPALLPQHAAIIPDLPGFGASPAPTLRPGLATWARLMDELLGSTGTTPHLVVGLGLGGSVALAYMQQRVASSAPLPAAVMLYAPVPHAGALRSTVRAVARLFCAPGGFSLARLILDRPAARAWLVSHLVAAPDPAPAEQLHADLQAASLPVLRGLVRDMLNADFRPLLRGFPTPLLTIVGARDPLLDAAEVARLTVLAPRAEVLVQPGITHGWTAAAVAEHHRVIRRFLDRLDSSRGGWGEAGRQSGA